MAVSRLSGAIGKCIPNIIIAVSLIVGSTITAGTVGTAYGLSLETVPLTSLMEAVAAGSSCRSASGHGALMLEVVHRHGPCSKDPRPVDHSETMIRDSLRVKWLGMKSRIHVQEEGGDARDSELTKSAVSVQTKLGYRIGTGNYLVTVHLGTPGKKLQLELDTGSGLTWTQCNGCKKCYKQTDPIFEPSKSTTFMAVRCSSPACSRLFSARTDPSHPSGCSKSHPGCGYSITYGDNSTSTGLISTDTLMLTSGDKIANFVFGCGLNNKGFDGSDGLLGLSNDSSSIISQTASMFGKYFSYCLPPTLKSTGFLNFGNGTTGRKPSNSTSLGFTPLIPTLEGGSTLYGILFTGINVGGTPLPKDSLKILSHAKAIIDSGTVVTRLPPTVYAAVRSAYQMYMAKYPKAPDFELLDTCYDFTKTKNITYPKIEFIFDGGVKVKLDVSGIFFVVKLSQVCLAIAPNDADSDTAIFGNMQQRTLEIAYDITGRKLGFSSNGCS